MELDSLIRLTGVTFEGRQRTIARLSVQDDIYLMRDPFNPYDRNAIGVMNSRGESIGWIPRETAAYVAPRIDGGTLYEVRINRILGGNDGLAYGVEIRLKEVATASGTRAPSDIWDPFDDRDFQDSWDLFDASVPKPIDPDMARIRDHLFHELMNQTEVEKEAMMKRLNQAIRESQEKTILAGDFEELAMLLRNRWLSMESIRSFAEFCFRTGRFQDCYRVLLTLERLSEECGNHDLVRFCREQQRVFHSFGYDEPLPAPSDELRPQSTERGDETYPELDRVNVMIENGRVDELITMLNREVGGTDRELRAGAFFDMGELYFQQNNLWEAYSCYMQAIRENPNKALYWGFAAQSLHRMKSPPLKASRLIMNAIQLDPENARWHLLQSLFLLNASRTENLEELMEQAVYEAELALSLCRPEQTSLRTAVLKLLGMEPPEKEEEGEAMNDYKR